MHTTTTTTEKNKKKQKTLLTIRGWFNKNKAGRSKLALLKQYFFIQIYFHGIFSGCATWFSTSSCHHMLLLSFSFFCRGWSENIISSPTANRLERTRLSASAIYIFFLAAKKCTSSTRTRSQSGETSYWSQQQTKAFVRTVYSFYVGVRTVLSGVTSN